METKIKMVRTVNAGVFFGEIEERKSETCLVLKNARRVYSWEGAATLSQLAESGTSKPENCQFPEPVTRAELIGVIEILDVQPEALKTLNAVKIWKA